MSVLARTAVSFADMCTADFNCLHGTAHLLPHPNNSQLVWLGGRRNRYPFLKTEGGFPCPSCSQNGQGSHLPLPSFLCQSQAGLFYDNSCRAKTPHPPSKGILFFFKVGEVFGPCLCWPEQLCHLLTFVQQTSIVCMERLLPL